MANDSAIMAYQCYYPISSHWEYMIDKCPKDKAFFENCDYCDKEYRKRIYQEECSCTKDGVARGLEDMPAMLDVWFWLYKVALPTIGGIGILWNTVAILILLSR